LDPAIGAVKPATLYERLSGVADHRRMQMPAILGRTFRARLHAWWEGYEFTPPAADPDADADKVAGVETKKPPTEKPALKDPWTRDRIEVAQVLWGSEYVSPLGAEAIAEPAALRSRESTAFTVSPRGGIPRLARTIPAKPVNATLRIIPGFESSIVETTIFAGALSICSIVFISQIQSQDSKITNNFPPFPGTKYKA
jgi:hypothetical protein